MNAVPWTFEPFEISPESTWPIYDPNLGQIVAVFHDQGEALMYLKWRNKKQAKRQERQRLSGKLRFDWDGSC